MRSGVVCPAGVVTYLQGRPLGVTSPWKRVKFTPGFGTKAANHTVKFSGLNSITCLVHAYSTLEPFSAP